MRVPAAVLYALLAGLTAGQAAAQILVPAGSDLLSTSGGGGQTYIDFSANPLPAGFFGPGSPVFEGVVELRGLPLNDNPGLAPPEGVDLGPTDLILQRESDVVLDGPGATGETAVRVGVLSVRNTQPIAITFEGGATTHWDMEVQTQFGSEQESGLMTIRQERAGGGTLDFMIPVNAGIFFHEIDAVPFNGRPLNNVPLVINAQRVPWTTSSGLEAVQLDREILLANGRAIAPTSGHFFFPHDFPLGGPDPRCRLVLTEPYNGARFGLLPSFFPSDGADADGDFVPPECDNCTEASNPLQEDTDGDLVGDACDTAEDCVSDAYTLCLNNGRFQVSVQWADSADNTLSPDPQDRNGRGMAHSETGQTGFFYFFDSDHIEMLVKVIDGCGDNGNYWVFAAAATNVEYTISVTDTLNGQTRQYANPLGTIARPVQDLDAFATCPKARGALPQREAPGAVDFSVLPHTSDREVRGTGPAILSGKHVVEERLSVEIDLIGPLGEVETGFATRTAENTYVAGFGEDGEAEVIVNLHFGMEQNGHFWVYAAGVSRANYVIRVTDQSTGMVRSYENPAGELSTFLDNEAFPTGDCPVVPESGDDCNENGNRDDCDIAGGSSEDCNANGVPDECEADSDGDGVIDACEEGPGGFACPAPAAAAGWPGAGRGDLLMLAAAALMLAGAARIRNSGSRRIRSILQPSGS